MTVDKKILILELGGIGDAVMSIPAIGGILNHFKNTSVNILTVSRTKPIVENLKARDFENFNIIATDALEKGGIDRWIGLIKEIRNKKYDIVIDLSAIETFKAAVKRYVFLKLLGVKELIGRDTEGRGWAFTKKAKEELTSNEHEVERKAKVVELLGVKIGNKMPVLITLQGEKEKAKDILSGWLNDNRLIVGINPGAYRPSRMWREERFKEIVKWLIEDIGAFVIVIGGDKERELVERIAESFPCDMVMKVIGMPILELAAVIERMALLITNDTGTMHIAAALNVPTVAIFGQANLFRYRPYMDSLRYVAIRKDYTKVCPYLSFKHPMEECLRYDCPYNCMDAVTVDDVKEAVKKLISKRQ